MDNKGFNYGGIFLIPPKIIKKLGLMQRVKKDVSYQQILNNLMDSEHNLGMKSRIPKPVNMAVLDSIGKYEERIQLKKSSKLVKTLVDTLLIFFVSDDGKGRIEVVNALAPMIEAERQNKLNSAKMIET